MIDRRASDLEPWRHGRANGTGTSSILDHEHLEATCVITLVANTLQRAAEKRCVRRLPRDDHGNIHGAHRSSANR
jgi:hypothetical protein